MTETIDKEMQVTLTVVESGEFHNLGEFYEGINSVDEAIAIFNQVPPERMNGIRSIGINIHEEGTEDYEDVVLDILSGNTIDLEILEYVPDITGNPKAMAIIGEIVEKVPSAEVLGSLEKYLEKLSEYKQLAKIEELEEANYNMIDNVINNEKPKKEQDCSSDRSSIKEKLAEKKAAIEQREKSEKSVLEKDTEKKAEREI